MPKIFLSYRRADSQWQTKAVYEALRGYVADPQTDIFYDLDSMTIGRNFRDRIDEAVEQCDILIAMIGRGWLTEVDDVTGARRLDQGNDFVRLEIAAALKRDIPVVPVLVDGTQMPQAEDLPEDIRELSFRHGVRLRPDSFAHDIGTMISGLGLNKQAAQPGARPAETDAMGAVKDTFSQVAAQVSGLAPSGTEAAKAWKPLRRSLSADEYQRFLERFPGTAESFEAERRILQLTDLAAIDKTDPRALAAWLYRSDGPEIYPALQDRVKLQISKLESQARSEQKARSVQKASVRPKPSGSSALGWLVWILLAVPLYVGAVASIDMVDSPGILLMMLGAVPSTFLVQLVSKGRLQRLPFLAALYGLVGGWVFGALLVFFVLQGIEVSLAGFVGIGFAGGGLLAGLVSLVARLVRRNRAPSSPAGSDPDY
ncbi:MAG: toll/interleukin-1 receptor domain-containing protein [Hyphomonas sp.]|nr:toll/interleukin-1 receptor domain-containing protein [Hyphomonas sp.]